MKKIFTTVCLSLFALSAYAQNQAYVLSDLDGTPYENNSVHTFNIHGTFDEIIDAAKLHLVITNEDFDDIYVRAEIMELINTDGTLVQFCIGGPSGNCFNGVDEGAFYPSEEGGLLEAAFSWGMNDYIINLDPTNNVGYKLRFVQTNGEGVEIPDTNFFITYRYESEMGVSDMQSLAFAQVSPTVAKGSTTVNLKENAQVQIVSLDGKVAKNLKMQSGTSQLDLSGLSAGVYWVTFKGEKGNTHSVKIVVK